MTTCSNLCISLRLSVSDYTATQLKFLELSFVQDSCHNHHSQIPGPAGPAGDFAYNELDYSGITQYTYIGAIGPTLFLCVTSMVLKFITYTDSMHVRRVRCSVRRCSQVCLKIIKVPVCTVRTIIAAANVVFQSKLCSRTCHLVTGTPRAASYQMLTGNNVPESANAQT